MPANPKGGGMKRIGVLVGVLLGVGAALAAGAQSDVAAQVLAVEKARVDALDRGDLGAIERILADDVRYVHASGHVDSKESYLNGLRSGQLKYVFWRPVGELRVQALGSAAVVSGEYAVRAIDLRVRNAPFDIKVQVLAVYARRNGRWQLAAYQSTDALVGK